MSQNILKKSFAKMISVVLIFLFVISLFPNTAHAAMDLNYGSSYFSYTFDYLGNPVATPAAFEPTETLNGFSFGDKAFNNLTDITYNGKDRIYIADSGNNRVLVCDENLKLLHILTEYDFQNNKSAFNTPTGIATMNGKVYIADSKNARIVVLNETTYQTEKVLTKPEIPALGEYTYIPSKLTVDYSGRIYVIADRINKGLIQLDTDGKFENFIGAPKTTPTAAQMLMRRFMPRSMRDQLIKIVPTEYHALNLDKDGFIFTTSKSVNVPPVSRLNGEGTNVLVEQYERRAGKYVDKAGNAAESIFIDVIPRDDGGYFALDSAQSRIFSYDKQGMLLYIFGFSGTSQGGFYSAVSLEYVNGKIIVLDNSLANITVFNITEFGEAVNEATRYASLGKIKEERTAWENVLRLCSNYDMAQISLAEIEINEKNYSSAMQRMSNIGEKLNYGKAFKYARTDWLKENFLLIVVGLVIVVAAIVLWVKVFQKSRAVAAIRSNAYYREMKYSTYVIFHPFDGFWDLKREKRGSMRAALTIFGLYVLFLGIRTKYSGYQFMEGTGKDINTLLSVSTIVIPILLFVISNWCFTTLMDGKGTLKDGFISVCYALTPYVILSPLQFVLSHVLIDEEMAFYTYLDVIIIAWVIVLFFFGMMMTHDYSFGKAFVTAVLSIIGICLILFICLLIFNLFSEFYSFVYNIYRELSFRFY